MRRICVLILFSLLSFFAKAQVTLYSDSFTTGATGWQLDQGSNFDTWIVNNIYSCSATTPDQGGGNYMHIYDDLNSDYCAVGVFEGIGSGGLVYATMTSGISTVGQTSVSIKFDWLCEGQTSILPSFGTIDYSVNGGSTWTNITQPIAKYSGQSTWKTTTITSAQVPAILNQADFRIRFGFTNSGYGNNPAFAIDNIVITGDVPTAVSPTLLKESLNAIIFPDPSKEEINIICNSLPAKSVITIYNTLGEKILICLKGDAEIKTVNIKNLSQGIYIVKIVNDGGGWTGKFAKD